MKNKALMTIFLVAFIDLLGFGIILPLLPFIAEKFNANPFQIGILSASYALFQFVSAPILGCLSDRYGRKKLLIISQIGSGLGYVLLGLANNLPLLFAARIIDGITGGNVSIAQAYIADITTPANRAKGMGIIGAAFGLGFIFGPALGGLLSVFGFAAPAFVAAGVAFLTVATTWLFLPETIDVANTVHSKKTSFSFEQMRNVFSLYPVGLLIVVFFLLNFAFTLFQGNFALWSQQTFRYGPTQTGFLFAYVGILMAIIQLKILPFVITRLKEKKCLRLGMMLLTLGILCIPVFQHPYALYVTFLLIALGNGLSNPPILALASESIPKEEYGGIMGIMQSAAGLGRIVGPAIGGELFFAFGKDIPFYAGGVIAFLIVLLLQLFLK